MRTSKTVDGETSRYYYDGKNIIAEETNGKIIRNINGINLIARQGEKELYYIYNGHADVVGLVNEEGILTNQYDYDEFGNIIQSSEGYSNTSKYAGYYYDEETGYYYLQSRYYDPETARFITEDTYQGKYDDPLSLNRYTYCHNNPISYNDPNGHWVETLLDVAGLIDSAVTMYKEPSIWNAAMLLWDAAAVVLPVVPGSYVAKGAKLLSRSNKAVDAVTTAVKHTDDVADAVTTVAKHADDATDVTKKVAKYTDKVKGKINDATKRVKNVLTDEGGYIKLPKSTKKGDG